VFIFSTGSQIRTPVANARGLFEGSSNPEYGRLIEGPAGHLYPIWSKYLHGLKLRTIWWALSMKNTQWARLLAQVTGMVNQQLLLQNEYLAAENRMHMGTGVGAAIRLTRA
jgi:hypothetical protein